MDKEARRAHLILQGQTLLDEWTEYCDRNVRLTNWAVPPGVAWDDAVRNELGPDGHMHWRWDGCELSNGEVYLFPTT